MPWRKLLPARKSTPRGTVYLLHFSRPFGRGKSQAQHYIGFTRNLEDRVEDHTKGRGSKLIRLVTEEGTVITVAKVWKDVDATFEYRLKNRGGAKRICPVCQQAHALVQEEDGEDDALRTGLPENRIIDKDTDDPY